MALVRLNLNYAVINVVVVGKILALRMCQTMYALLSEGKLLSLIVRLVYVGYVTLCYVQNALITGDVQGGDLTFCCFLSRNYFMESNINNRQTAELDEWLKSGKLALPLRNKC